MKKLHDFQLVTSFIGLMISIFGFKADPTLYSFMSAVFFTCLMVLSSYGAFEEDKHEAE